MNLLQYIMIKSKMLFKAYLTDFGLEFVTINGERIVDYIVDLFEPINKIEF